MGCQRRRSGCALWRRDDVENLWCVGDPELEDLAIRGVVGLQQGLR